MRTIRWTEFAPVGDGETEVSGSVADFFLSGACTAIVYLRIVPPLLVLNTLAASGDSNHGMGGAWKWEPFKLSEIEYEELVSALVTATPPSGLRPIEPMSDVPEWVQDEADLNAWIFFVPEELYLPISDERKRVQRQIRTTRDETERSELMERLEALELRSTSLYVENVNQRRCRVPNPRIK